MTVQSVELGKNPLDSAGSGSAEKNSCGSGHACMCQDEGNKPVILDARTIPHAIRHAAVLGALSSLNAGFSLDLIAPHDPLPLLAQIDREFEGAILQSYVEKGPDQWVVRFTRR